MKQEANKKSKKWLWLVIALVALLAVVGVVLALVLGGGQQSEEGPVGGRADLYWNVDKAQYTENSEAGLSTREPADDGIFYVRFAHEGEQVELKVADKRLINFIDTMNVMGLVQDENGVVVDAIDPTELATRVGEDMYVQSVTADAIVVNTSMAMNGMTKMITISELTEIYDVSAEAEVIGAYCDITDFQPMDTVTIYANDMEENTHVYLTSHPVETKIYWRADQNYVSATKETGRIPDENGAYTVPFYCEGERLELKCKDKALVTKFDSVSRYSPHFGLIFDEEGYIVDYVSSALGIRGALGCERFDITEIDGDTFTATRLLTNDGSSFTGTLTADTKIYDVSLAAQAENRAGQQVDSLQMGDRVCVWTDTTGTPVVIYVATRLVESPAYWIPTRKYDSTLKETTREPNWEGYYEVELLKEGTTETAIYKTKDKATMSSLDSMTSKTVGLKVNGNIIEYVYDSECLYGYTPYSRGGVVTSVSGIVFTKITYGQPDTESSGVLDPSCKVYNVSAYGQLGEETTLRVGDHMYAHRKPTGELVAIFITRRQIGGDTLYYNLERLYDAETKTTTREPDADGWYVFQLAYKGKQVTLKTKSKEIASKVDSFSPEAMALEVSGNVILAAYDPIYAYAGNKVASGYRYNGTDADGTVNTYYKSGDTYKEVSFKMAENCAIYNVSPVFESFRGERIYSMRADDMLTCFANIYGEVEVIFVRQRKVDNLYWKTEILYDSTNKCTKRVPDADGWYYYDLAVNGELKRFKTNDVKIANSMDSYAGAFGLDVKGDVIKSFLAVSAVKNVTGNGVITWDVVSINGRNVTVKYNKPGSTNTGKTQTITLASNAKIYDVSPTAEKFGQAAQLKVGDSIRTYVNADGVHTYVYIQFRDTRKGGAEGYCEVCKKNVHWNPWAGGAMSYADGHWYLVGDCTTNDQTTVGSESKDYSVCVDLNGHTLTRNAEGRFALVRYGDTLNIIDSVGGGKILSSGGNATGTGYSGGVIMVSNGKVNMYGGTLEMKRQDGIKNGYGGNVYISGEEAVFNMYGGTITGGISYSQNASKPGYGGNIYITKGTFNMLGGTISNGEAHGGIFDVTNADGTVTVKKVVGYGGNIFLTGGAKVNITGGSIVDGAAVRGTRVEKDKDGNEVVTKSSSYGGNIYCASKSGVLNVSNATISGGEATRGGNIYGMGINTFTNATITDGVAWQHGGNFHITSGEWLFADGTKVLDGISGNPEFIGSGGNLSIYGGVVTIEKATIDGGIAGGSVNGLGGNYKGTGGNINITQDLSGDLILNICDGAVISNGIAAADGGNINQGGPKTVTAEDGTSTLYVPVLNISGGQIINGLCDALASGQAYGGNIRALGHMTISGGMICGGMQDKTPYDIYVTGSAGDVAISGGTIEAKLRVYQAKSLVLSGTPKIGELNMYTLTKLDLGELKDGADISVIASGVFANASDNAQAYLDAGYIKACDELKQVAVNENKELYIEAAPIPELEGYCQHCDQVVTWTGWSAEAGVKGVIASGHYYLAADDTELTTNYYLGTSASDTEDVAVDVVIDLKGHTIASTKRAFYIFKNSSLSIMDSVGGGAVKGALTTVAGGVIYLGDGGNGKLDLYGGSIIDTSSSARTVDGGAIQVAGNSVFTLHDGVVTGNSAKRGGAIYNNTGTVIIKAGTVNGGTTTDGGDCIYLGNGTLDIQGGTINGQVLTNAAANVSLSGAPVLNNLDLTKGTLLNLGALTDGADITVNAAGVFTKPSNDAQTYAAYFKAVSGETITVTADNELAAGTVVKPVDPDALTYYCEHCKKEVTWTKWDSNVATEISGNDVHYYLKDDYLQKTQRTIVGDIILDLKGNTLSVEAAARLFLMRGELSVLDTVGGGKMVAKGLGAKGNGGLALVSPSSGSAATLNLYGGTLTMEAGHEPVMNGGVLYFADGATLNMYGGTITGGTTAGQGSNVMTSGATVNISGGTVDGGLHISGKTVATISGNAKVANVDGGLDLTSGSKLQLGELAEGAEIYVTANGVFTADNDKAADYADYFKSAVADKVVTVVGKTLAITTEGGVIEPTEPEPTEPVTEPTEPVANAVYEEAVKMTADGIFDSVIGGVVTADCPYCGATGVQWQALEAVTGSRKYLSGTGHYYLADDLVENSGFYFVGDASANAANICLHLNGHSISNSKGTGNDARVIYVEKNATLNIMGDGNVSGGCGQATRGALDICGMLNLCGGTYVTTTSEYPVIYSRGTVCAVNVYDGTTVGTADMTSTGIQIAKCELNAYGGTLYGTTISNAGTELTVGGDVKISNLDLTSRVLANLGKMTDGAEIFVTADGVFTVASNKAADYADYFKSAVADKTISVVDNTLAVTAQGGSTEPAANDVYAAAVKMTTDGIFASGDVVTADCPACGAEGVQWKPLTEAEAANTKLAGTYHYYLADELTTTKRFDIGADSVAATACIHLNGKSITHETERVFYVPKLSELTLMGDGTVSGAYEATKVHYASTIDVTGILNLCGGTYQHASAHPVITARGTNASYLCAINVYDGTVIQGNAELSAPSIWLNSRGTLLVAGGTIENGNAEKGGNIYAEAGNTSATISGGIISGGEVYLENSSSITLSGDAKISELDLTSGILVNLGELVEGAEIYVTADGVFTAESNKAADYAVYFKSAVADKVIGVVGNTLAVTDQSDVTEPSVPETTEPVENPLNKIHEAAKAMTFTSETVEAVCPVCAANGDSESKTWSALPAPTGASSTALAAGHYYVAEDMEVTKFYYIKDTDVCLNLNGKSITGTARVFYKEGANTALNIMGDGIVTGAAGVLSNSRQTGTIDTTGIVNLFGGTYTSSTEYAVVSVRGSKAYNMLNMYEGTVIQRTADGVAGLNVFLVDEGEFNMYGGSVTGGTAIVQPNATNDVKNGGNFYIAANGSTDNNAYSSALNIYGGTVSGGTAANEGGNIYVVGNNLTKPSAAVTVAGGTVENGSIYVTGANASVTVSGKSVVSELDLTNGTLLNLGALENGADITVIADGAFTVANENAQAYLNAGYIKAADGMTISVTDNVMSMAKASLLVKLAKMLNILCTGLI